jgi:magnesium-transporting ATPase (P-type)
MFARVVPSPVILSGTQIISGEGIMLVIAVGRNAVAFTLKSSIKTESGI